MNGGEAKGHLEIHEISKLTLAPLSVAILGLACPVEVGQTSTDNSRTASLR